MLRNEERPLDIEELMTFVEVADAGGVSPAARRLGLSKSIVSRRLNRLEEDLGVQLLARSTRGAALTEAGATFRDFAARIVADVDTARETLDPAGELRGRFRISAPLSFGPTHFAPVFAQMARRNRKLQIQTCYSDHVVDLIGEGFDCAIRVGHLRDSNLVARRVAPMCGRLVASPDYIAAHGAPETPDDLMAHEALMQGLETWRFIDGDKVIRLRAQGVFKADNGTALVSAALEGLGIGYLPDGLTHEHLKSGALVPVMTRYPVPEAGVYVVRPPGQFPSRKVRVLTEMLLAHFEKAPFSPPIELPGAAKAP